MWRTDRFEPKTVISKLSNFSSQNELVAVQKTLHSIGLSKAKLLTAHDLGYTIASVSGTAGGKELSVVQRYIKSIGSKAFKVRTVWTKNKPPVCYIVTNHSSYYEYDGEQDVYKYVVVVSETQKGHSSIFKTNKGKQLTDTLPYVENIVRYFRGAFGTEIYKIAADFIKDEAGIWWLINVKQILFETPLPESRIKKVVLGEDDEEVQQIGTGGPKRPEGYHKIKLCRYCETPFHSEELTHKMNLKMAIELDRHLKCRGYRFEWLNRSERQFIDTSNLYEVHKVCKICYKLYEHMVLLNTEFEQFSKHCGIPVMRDRNGQAVSITTLKDKPVLDLDVPQVEQGSHYPDDVPEEEPKNEELGLVRLGGDSYLQQKSRQLSRFRFIIFLQCINDIPVRQVRTHPLDTFWLEVDVLDHVLRYKVEPQYLQIQKDEPGFCRLDMNRLSIKYFFSEDRQGLKAYIHQAKTIEMRLCRNHELTALYSFQIELQDFVSEQVPTRNYQKYFTVETDYLRTLSWELVFTLGVHEDRIPVDVGGMLLREYKGLTLPPSNYYSYDPLPESWAKILARRDVRKATDSTVEMVEFQALPTFKKEDDEHISQADVSGSLEGEEEFLEEESNDPVPSQSDKFKHAERGTEAEEAEASHETDDQLLEELNQYNHKLNQAVGRVLNEGREQ